MRSDATIPSGCKWPGRRQNGILGRERGCVNGNVLGVSPGEDRMSWYLAAVGRGGLCQNQTSGIVTHVSQGDA